MTALEHIGTTIDTDEVFLKAGTANAGDVYINDGGTMRLATEEEQRVCFDRIGRFRTAYKAVRQISR